MKFSAPVYRLKHRAKILSREQGVPLHLALDRIARQEGFDSWSLLANRASSAHPTKDVLDRLVPGDLMLLAARPGQGKTRFGLELAVGAMKAGRAAAFFTLEFVQFDMDRCFVGIDENPQAYRDRFFFDDSDDISAAYIIDRMQHARRDTVVIIDYLQLLDQDRSKPDLASQVMALRSYAKDKGLVIVFLSQIDRKYDPAARPVPELSDVRMPNHFDLGLFSKTCFIHGENMRVKSFG